MVSTLCWQRFKGEKEWCWTHTQPMCMLSHLFSVSLNSEPHVLRAHYHINSHFLWSPMNDLSDLIPITFNWLHIAERVLESFVWERSPQPHAPNVKKCSFTCFLFTKETRGLHSWYLLALRVALRGCCGALFLSQTSKKSFPILIIASMTLHRLYHINHDTSICNRHVRMYA